MSPGIWFCLFVCLVVPLSCHSEGPDDHSEPPAKTEDSGTDNDRTSRPVLPFVLPGPTRTPMVTTSTEREPGVDWGALLRASGRFLVIEHGFRLLTEPGTRSGLKGGFLRNYADAVSNLHGWADGDDFYVNYVGHPMEGSVAGFLWAQNDRKYSYVEFGNDPAYWKSRLRAAGFMWAYSTQFEIGPLSEASIGSIQAAFPQQGLVDHAVTPVIGLGWMIAEDVLDKYLVKRIEAKTRKRWIRILARSAMNPSRSFANILQNNPPWHRDSRPGITEFVPPPASRPAFNRPATGTAVILPDRPGPPPFEFSMTFQHERIGDANRSMWCAGGAGTAAVRIAPAWQIAAEVGGCKLIGLERNLSGDSLTYMAGPRWVSSGSGPWIRHLQILVGGNKMTEERMWPEKKRLLDQAAIRDNQPPPAHEAYTDAVESNGFALTAGGGVDYKMTRALAIRVAEVSYRRSWVGPLWGREYSSGFRVVSGLVLRMGTW